MQTKLFTAAILFICCASKIKAQEQLYNFKSSPVPFNKKLLPNNSQILRPYLHKNLNADTLRFSHQTEQGLIYTAPQDGMQVLKPYSSTIDYEKKRTQILKPYIVEPFGKPSNVEPMPNPLRKALIFEGESK